jgi:hypothetical protein
MHMQSEIRIWITAIALLGCSSLGFWSCNISESKGSTILRLKLHDSLSTENGYDSVVVDLYDNKGKLTHPRVFAEPYSKSTDSVKLANISLAGNVPDPLVIKINVYKDGVKTWVLEINIVDGRPDSKPPIYVGPKDSIPSSNGVKPSSISFRMSTPMTLAAGDTATNLSAHVLPDSASQEIVWTSSDTSKVKITADNKVKPIMAGTSTITAKSKVDAAVSADFTLYVIVSVKVDGIAITPKSMPLFSGGDLGKVTVTMFGGGTGAKYILSSSEPSVATVDANGSIKGWKAGIAFIRASVVGYSAIASVCTVTVVTDPPAPTVTENLTVEFGAEATFDISVSQAHGIVAEIKADMDGDGDFEQNILAKNTAQFKAKYSQAKTFNLSFTIKDSEGNSVEVFRTVTVKPPVSPVVDIFDPATDITINQLSYPIRFTVKDPSQSIDISKDSIVSLDDGPNVISVSRSNAGGTGKDQVTLIVNRNAPGVPILVSQAPSTNDNTPTWTWGAVTGAAKYQVRIGDGDFSNSGGNFEKTTLSHTLGTSADGEYTLYVRSVDGSGNFSSSASQTMVVDTKAPDTVKFSGIDNEYTGDATPTWSWSPSATNGGINSYEVTLDGSTTTTVNATTYTPGASLSDNQTHTLSVRQKDHVDGVLGAAKAFRYQVAVNPPAAPVVSGPSGVVNGGLTKNLEFSWASGARGLDRYRIRVNSESGYRDTLNTTRSFSLPSNTIDGTYTIHVEEVDGLGRWGAEGAFTIVLDRTAPVVSITTRNNFITNKSPANIEYKVDGIAATASGCNLVNIDQANTCTVSSTDPAGNKTEATTTVYFRPKTYFINVNNPVDGDGSSWESAKKDPTALMATLSSKNEFWMAAGEYPNLVIKFPMTVLGGFVVNSTSFPVTAEGRSPAATIVQNISTEGLDRTTDVVSIDRLLFLNGLTSVNCTMNLSESKFTPASGSGSAISLQDGGVFTAKNVTIEDGTFVYNVMSICQLCTATLESTKISNNSVSWSPGYAIQTRGVLRIKSTSSVSGNVGPAAPKQIGIYESASTIIELGATFNCADIEKIDYIGIGYCNGNQL